MIYWLKNINKNQTHLALKKLSKEEIQTKSLYIVYVHADQLLFTFISHKHGTKKKTESPMGIEPMASQIPVARSDQRVMRDSW